MTTIEELRATNEDREHLLADLLEKAATELETLTQSLAEVTGDLNGIDELLARRPIFYECVSRYEKIQKAIAVAKTADDIKSRLTASESANRVMREACVAAYSALDDLMGDGDLESDDSKEMKAMQLLSKIITTSAPPTIII